MIDPRKAQEFKQYFAEFKLLVGGELDAEYKRVADLIAKWDERRNYDMLKSKLDQDRADFKVEVASFTKEREKYTADLTKAHAELTARDKEVVKAEAKLAEAQSAFIAEKSNQEAAHEATKKLLQKRSLELDHQQADIESMQKALHAREKELVAKHDRVNKAMTTLSELRG
jgi:uncharacterized protein involved in exopolysaccharide biosynthesis